MQTLIDIDQRLDQILEGRPHLGVKYTGLRNKYKDVYRTLYVDQKNAGSFQVFTELFLADHVYFWSDSGFKECVVAVHDEKLADHIGPYKLFTCTSSDTDIKNFVEDFGPNTILQNVTADIKEKGTRIQINFNGKSIQFNTTPIYDIPNK